MANELRYTISGDTRDFERAIKRVDRDLDRTERTSARFARGFTRNLGAIGTAAGTAALAIGAGLTVEAKRAIEAFQESNKVTRQTAAVLKSTGGAANVTAKEVGRLADSLSKKSGVDDELIASGENVLLTFQNIRNEAGKGNDIFRQATRTSLDLSVALGRDLTSGSRLVGRALDDPIKGMSALTRVGVQFNDGQKAQIKTLVESGRRLEAQRIILGQLQQRFEGSAEAQATSTGKLKVAFGNLEEGIGSGLLPAFDRVVGRMTRFAIDVEPKVSAAVQRITRPFSRKDLSLAEAFRMSTSEAESVFRPLIEQAGRAIDRLNPGQKFARAIEVAVPKIADTLAAHAPEAAESFVKAFINANVWGRLLVGGFLLKKMGGLGAFAALGRRGAAAMGTGVAAGGAASGIAGAAAGAAGGAAAGGLRGALGRGAGALSRLRLPGAAGIATAGLLIGPEVYKELTKGSGDAADKLKELDRQARKTAGGSLTAYQRELDRTAKRTRAWSQDTGRFTAESRRYWDKVADGAEEMSRRTRNATDEMFGRVRVDSDKLKAVNTATSASWAQLARNTGTRLRNIKDTVSGNMQLIKKDLTTKSDEGRRALANNFRDAAKAVERQMDRSGGATKEGTALVRRYLVDALKSLGLSGAQAQAKVTTGTVNTRAPLGGNTAGNTGDRFRAGGGWVGQRGQRGHDTVPVLMGAGEAVLNRHQQEVIEGHLGDGFLDTLFSKVQTPHYFARGGKIPRVGVRRDLGVASSLAQRAVDIDRREAQRIYNRKLEESLSANTMGGGRGGGASSTTGLVPQVKRALAWARSHGWTGGVNSGFRSRAQQEALWANRGSNPNPVAPPGTSNHERGRAVDVSDIPGFQRAMASAPPNARLIWFGPGDPVHFSVDGHARGGRLKRFAKGGFSGPLNIGDWGRLWKSAWKYLAPKLGRKGSAPPELVFGGAFGKNYADYDPATKKIHISAAMQRDMNRRQGPSKDYAIETIAHEMAHAAQKQKGLSFRAAEGGAEIFGNKYAFGLADVLGLSYGGNTGFAYEKESAWVAEHKSRRWINKGQFGIKRKKKGQKKSDEFASSSRIARSNPGRYIFNYFRSKGFTNAQAAGFVGNFTQESGLQTGAINPRSGAAGLGQWLGGRKTALMTYAKKRGKPWTDLNTQLDFVMYELRGPEAVAYERIKNAKGVTNATSAIGTSYERYGPTEEGERLGPARSAYDRFRTTDARAKQMIARAGGGSGASSVLEKPTRLDHLQARTDLAALTKTKRDDRRAAAQTVRYWRQRLAKAKRSKDPRRVSEAAQGLAGALSTQQELRAPSTSPPSIASTVSSMANLAAAEAELTPDTADDLAANATMQGVVTSQLDVNAARMKTAKGAKLTRLTNQRVDLLGTLKSLQDAATTLSEAAEDTTQQDILQALQDIKETNEGIKAALDQQVAYATKLGSTQDGVFAQYVTDVVSGIIGTGALNASRTPGYAAQRF